jgi:SAM-dependent methyltransferase
VVTPTPPQAGETPIASAEGVRAVFAERDASGLTRARYSFFNPAHLHFWQERERYLIELLRHHGFGPARLERSAALSVGCGTGTELLDLVRWGATPRTAFGVDLEPGRLRRAKSRHAALGLAHADGRALPFRAESFDLVLQFTLFTSVLDREVRRAIAREMLRVLRPDGMIVWYDFWMQNPANPRVRGIGRAEIRSLFPGCRFDFRRLTLPPPLARRVVPLSWEVADILSLVPFLGAFHLAGIVLEPARRQTAARPAVSR